jgi:hypothetical protein
VLLVDALEEIVFVAVSGLGLGTPFTPPPGPVIVVIVAAWGGE